MSGNEVMRYESLVLLVQQISKPLESLAAAACCWSPKSSRLGTTCGHIIATAVRRCGKLAIGGHSCKVRPARCYSWTFRDGPPAGRLLNDESRMFFFFFFGGGSSRNPTLSITRRSKLV